MTDQTPTLTPAQLAEIEARTEAATPGPWAQMKGWSLEIVPAADADKGLGASIYPSDDLKYAQPIAKANFDDFTDPAKFSHRRVRKAESLADAAFIAHSRADIPALLSHLRALEADNARLTRERDHHMRESLQKGRDLDDVFARAEAAEAENARLREALEPK